MDLQEAFEIIEKRPFDPYDQDLKALRVVVLELNKRVNFLEKYVAGSHEEPVLYDKYAGEVPRKTFDETTKHPHIPAMAEIATNEAADSVVRNPIILPKKRGRPKNERQ